MVICTDLEVDRGRTTSYVITFKDNDSVAIDINGWTIFMTVKSEYDTDETDAEAIISKTISTHTDPTSGITTITLSKDDTEIEPSVYSYDITYLKDDSVTKATVQEGKFTVSYSYTNRDA